MRILYGVTGEGMGHAMRSRVVLEHLLAAGHEIEIVASSRAADYLSSRFGGTTKIHGFHMVLEENRIRRGRTVLSNVIASGKGVPKNIKAYFELIDRFEPQIVISDFESWTYLYAKTHRLPIVSIDNMQIINRCEHPAQVIAGDGVLRESKSFHMTKAFVKAKLPYCDHYLITTFFHSKVRKERTSLHPPILRPEILAARSEQGEHLLVYQSGPSTAVEEALKQTGLECRIYGMRKGLQQEETSGKLRHMPFSEEGFVTDLATSRAVIAGAGFTLMGEAVYLRKPMLAIPLVGQFEQVLNARYLEHVGFGQWAHDEESALTRNVAGFLERVPHFEQALSQYKQDGNRQLLAAVDSQLESQLGARS